MSFKRNCRMPAFIWGGCAGTPLSWTPALPGSASRWSPSVPIGERLVRVIYPSDSSPRTHSDSPCDNQLPWMQFTAFNEADESIFANCLGLTLFGEAYFFRPTQNIDSGNPNTFSRKILPVRCQNVGKPFKRLAINYALSTDGKVWRLETFDQEPQQCTIPGGETIVDLMPIGDTQSLLSAVAVGQSGAMYFNRNSNGTLSSTTFYKMSKWVGSLHVDDPGSYPQTDVPTDIQLLFSDPPTGGRRATGYVTVLGTSIISATISDAGWGYADTPSVSITGTGSGQVSATLENNIPFRYSRGYGVSSSGDSYRFDGAIRDMSAAYGSSWRTLLKNVFSSAGLGIKDNGELWAFGDRWLGNASFTPAKIANGNWLAIARTDVSAAAIRDDYTLWTWGLNFNGTLGDSIDPDARRTTPTQINVGTEWVDVFGFGGTQDGQFIAIQKDSQRREHGQAFEFWPDSYFAGTA
jgi:hypothetical protein